MRNRTFILSQALQTLRRAAWAPACLFIVYPVLSLGFYAYALYPDLDMPKHFLDGATLGYFCLHALDAMHGLFGRLPRSARPLLAFDFVTTAAVFWEFYEFLPDRFLCTRLQHGLADTKSDLMFGMAGCLAVLMLDRLSGGSSSHAAGNGKTASAPPGLKSGKQSSRPITN